MKGKIMKKLCAVSISALMLTGTGVMQAMPFVGTGLSVNAATPADDFEYRIDDDGVAILEYYGDSSTVEIPSTIEGKPVVRIGGLAYYDWEALTSKCSIRTLIIPNGVTRISEYAFADTGITSITFPNSLIDINAHAFDYCTWYSKQPNGDLYINGVYVRYKGTMPYGTVMNFKQGTKSISSYAMCSKEHEYPYDDVRYSASWFNDMFTGQSGLVRANIPDGVTYIGDFAFSNCNNLKRVDIPDSVTKIEKNAFSNISYIDVEYEVDKKITKNSNLTIYGVAGSFAETYAKENGIKFSAIPTLSLDKTELNMDRGDTYSLTAKVSPKDSTVEWSTSNSAVATVENGVITAVDEGTAIITAKGSNGCEATCTVNVTTPVSSITLNKTTLEMFKGDTSTIKATVKPADATDKTVTWTTSNSKVATVKSGKVTAVGDGTATITAETSNGLKATCKVSVSTPVEAISLNKTSLEMNIDDYTFLTATILPADATDKTVTWSTTDSEVATVKNGKVIAVGEGTATITAKSSNGFTANCVVTVNPPLVPLENTSKLSKTSVYAGTSITVKCSSTGGTGDTEYEVQYKSAEDTNWTTAQDYSRITSVIITPKKGGSYTIIVNAKDSSGEIDSKRLILNVLPGLENTSTVSASQIIFGGSVTVKASATGGKGTYQYAVWYQNPKDGKWYKAQDYKTNSKVTIKPKHTGKYVIRVNVKDERGKVVKKDFSVNVMASLKNTSTISADTVKLGGTVKITGSSTGGLGEKEYGYWYYSPKYSKWYKIADYSASTSASFKPKHTGEYKIRINVKDERGVVAKKTYTVTVTK